jgi:hypothetical protein
MKAHRAIIADYGERNTSNISGGEAVSLAIKSGTREIMITYVYGI